MYPLKNPISAIFLKNVSNCYQNQQRFPPEYYSSHPLVLGPGFSPRDLRLDAVNRLSYREAGIVVMGVNAPVFASKINAARMLRTFRVKVSFSSFIYRNAYFFPNAENVSVLIGNGKSGLALTHKLP